MDLTQSKLSKAEWMNVEIPVSDQEKQILEVILEGYHNVNLRKNQTQSLLTFMKIEHTSEIEDHLYKQYFERDVQDMVKTYENALANLHFRSTVLLKEEKGRAPVIKTRDLIRIQTMDQKIQDYKTRLFEFILLQFCRDILTSYTKKTSDYAFALYTLIQLKKSSISRLNKRVVLFVDEIIRVSSETFQIKDVLHQAQAFIEKNPYLLKFADQTLFTHQKEIFTIFKQSPRTAKLVLYTAPTGTGKTLSPIGLSEGHRIIFICAARHVGLALAKSAVSVGKRIAIAFGCESAADIRLHYFAASEYTRNRKSGGIGKVDNSVGDKVEIMICDVQSYLTAMHYMLAFSPISNQDDQVDEDDCVERQNRIRDDDLITYWDEPTITMDYEDHPLHAMIQRNWAENCISKVVLSCATLPREEEIQDTLIDFRGRFQDATVHTILSYDCRKSISLLNKAGKSVVPHLLYSDFQELQTCVDHCKQNKTLLRYFDLAEIVELIKMVHDEDAVTSQYRMEHYFQGGMCEVTMNSIKLYYLDLLQNMDEGIWPILVKRLRMQQVAKFRSLYDAKKLQEAQMGISLTTYDAYTLTDGPTIFLTEDVEKVGRFYIQQSAIPMRVFQTVAEKIAQNSAVQMQMETVSRLIEDKTAAAENKEQSGGSGKSGSSGKPGKSSGKSGKKGDDKKAKREATNPELTKLNDTLEGLQGQIKTVTLDNAYIPNTMQHQRIWLKDDAIAPNAFVPTVDEESIRDIMGLDATDQMKLLLLMGIGMFVDEKTVPPRYMEVMKRLANKQQLFLILASSDYIYGTNYQFCHGFVGKDLTKMTQQKTIQAMGRIGRNQTQQEYTVRFRDDDMLLQLFQAPTENTEAVIMSRLFSSEN